jgi:Ca2+/H+ antiporter, TMEM165/GDT1 family
LDWTQTTPVVVAAFLASLVEFVEALTIVMAAGITRGWRSSLAGAAAATAALALLVGIFGPALEKVPVTVLQLAIGVLILLFGLHWLRKAILRSAGVMQHHDEPAIFEKETKALQGQGKGIHRGIDQLGFVTSFNATFIEGVEVVFIVIAVGSAGRALLPAAAGAAAAGVLVVLLGVIVHRPLARVPENTLKFTVGLILASFGIFWIGEGLKFQWPGGDLALLGLFVISLLVSRVGVVLARRSTRN